jgi:ATP-binding cassette subfamily C protein LapB
MIGGPLEAGAIQRIAIIRAILNDPAVLLLNEADEGLDLAGRSRLASLLPTLTDITILLSPSDSAMNSAFPSCLRLSPEGVAIHQYGCTPGGAQ